MPKSVSTAERTDPTIDPNSPWFEISVIAVEDGSVDLFKDNVKVTNIPSWMADDHSHPEMVAYVRSRVNTCVARETARVKSFPINHGMPDDWFDMIENGVFVKRCKSMDEVKDYLDERTARRLA